jgi:hypothetical protein
MKAMTTTSTKDGLNGVRPGAHGPGAGVGRACDGSRTGAQDRLSRSTIAAAATTNHIDQAARTEPRPSWITPIATAPSPACISPSVSAWFPRMFRYVPGGSGAGATSMQPESPALLWDARRAAELVRSFVAGKAWTDYVEPFNLPEGNFAIETRAADLVGQRTAVTAVKGDTTSPFIHATQASRSVWSRLLGPSSIQLRFRVADNLSGPVNAWVVIYDVTGNPVRIIQHPTINLVPGAAPAEYSVTWNGQQQSLTGLVPIGVYHYRVAVVDEAGNVAFSGESRPITIRLL